MARHAAVDLDRTFRTLVFRPPRLKVGASDGTTDVRLPPAERARLRDLLAAVGGASGAGSDGQGGGVGGVNGVEGRLDELRTLYEPYLAGLAERLLLDLPPWVPAPGALDDWQTTPDGVTAPSIVALVSHKPTVSGTRS